MNAKIDMAAALLLYLIACFGATLALTGSLPLAMFTAYIAGVLARIAYLKWLKPRLAKRAEEKKRLSRARRLVKSWAFRPDEVSALKYVSSVLDMAGCDFLLLPRHESSHDLDATAILDLWRIRRERESLVIAATGGIDSKACEIALSLKSPRVSLLDAAELSRIIAKSPLDIPNADAPERKRLVNLRIDRKAAPRIILSAISAFFIYAVTNKTIYLLSASALLFLALSAYIRKPRTRRSS